MATEAEVADMPIPPYTEFVEQILYPKQFSSFRETLQGDTVAGIQVHLHEDPADPDKITRTLEFDDMYPIQTVYDLQTRIYMEMGELNRYHPINQSLLQKTTEGYNSFLHIFNNKNINIGNPFLRIIDSNYDIEFVKEGTIQYIKIASQERITLYTKLFQFQPETDVYSIHCFLFDDIISRYEGVKNPMSPEEWAGRMKPFFPLRQEQQSFDDMSARVQRFNDRQVLMECLETVLRDKELRQPGVTGRGDPVSLANFRMLRIGWNPLPKSDEYETLQLDNIFYSMPLSETIPYIRFFPKQGLPLSKVYVKGILPIPAMDRPEILSQWAQERSPVPEEDLVYCKVLLRPAAGSVPPLYGTFYIFESGAGKFVIQPNEGEKSLSRQVELRQLRYIIEYITSIVPKQNVSPKIKNPTITSRSLFTPANIVLEDAYVVFSMWLDMAKNMPISSKNLQQILPYFLPLVQVTKSPIAEQNPLLFLRYKGIDNFLTQSRDFQFLKAVQDLQVKKGAVSYDALTRYYRDEFDVPNKVAEQRVAAFLRQDIEYQIVNPEVLSFQQVENPGIDIAIFGKHPTYTIHVYRVNDIFAYKTIMTLLSVLVSVTIEDFGDDCTAAARRSIQYQATDIRTAEIAAAAKTADVATLKTDDTSLAKTVLLTAENASENITPGEYDSDLDDIEDSFAGIPLSETNISEKQNPADSMPLSTLIASDAPTLEEEDEEFVSGVQDAAQLKQIPAKTYFSERLQFYDRRLFSYKKGPGVKQYPRMCSSTASRQPTVMNEEEYKRMREVYAPDEQAGFVQFVDLPLKPLKSGEKYDTKYDIRTKERITTLRYGTALAGGVGNIYICSQYWCRKDEIVVLKRDFESTKDRKMNIKPKNSCPFCYGRLVQNRDIAVEGETVIERTVKDKGNRPHTFVQFLTTGQHPEGFSLPCCFLSDKPIYDTHPAFQTGKTSRPLPTLKPTAEPSFDTSNLAKPSVPQIEDEIEEDIDEDGVDDITPLYKVNYPQRLEQMLDKKPYITGAEKFPLDIRRDGPQIGVLSKAQDKYFAQTSIPGLVKQHHTVWKLITDDVAKGDKKKGEVAVSGFLRIAVDNRKRVQTESFLAAVAPVLGFNSTYELKTQIMRIMTLRFFIQMNYGNLLLEFYDPNFQLPGFVPENPRPFIQKFIKEHLTDKITIGTNTESILRAAKSWYRFHEMFTDVDVVKENRQFATMFSYPGYFTPNGVVFIVLETDDTGGVTVRCPPYGVSEAMAKRCDVAFLSFTPKSKIWEPIFYTKNNATTSEHTNLFVFSSDERDQWPPIVRARAEEFYNLCKSSGLGLYTDAPFVNPKTLLPLGRALTLPLGENTSVFAVLRDAYNHVSAVLYALEENRILFVHAIDDGTPHEEFRTEFDWENNMFRIADADQTLSFYTETLLPSIQDLGEQVLLQYTPKEEKSGRFFKMPRIRVKGVPYIYGISFMGGLNIPVHVPIKETEDRPYVVKAIQPWQMDKKLVFGEKDASITMEMTPQEFQEVFQHLRLTFSNWFAFEVTPDLKKRIQSILFDSNGYMNTSIPVMEKREMLKVLLGPVVMNWLDSSIPVVGQQPSMRRVDCHLQKTADTCTNFCVWKETSEGSSQCLLHTDETITLGSTKIPARDILVAKLFEELIRFPILRDQLLKQKVSSYQKLYDSFRSGNQYIVAESMPSWTELLRSTWQKDTYEKPRFMEELAVGEVLLDEEEEEKEKEETLLLPVLPKVLYPLFQSTVSYSFLHGSFFEILGDLHMNLLSFLQNTDATLDLTVPFSVSQVEEIAKQLQHSIAVIRFEEENPILKKENIQIVRVKLGSVKAPTQPFFIFVQLPTGETGVLSTSSSEILPLQPTSISKLYKTLFITSPKLLILG